MDKNKKITEIINGISPVSTNSLNKILSITHFETIEKNKIFIKKDIRNKYEYIVIKGICRSYLLNHEGEDVTISFFTENMVLTPNTARTFKNCSSLNFQALTEVEIGILDAEKLVELMTVNPEIRGWANIVLQNELVLKSQKEINAASLSAKDRLIAFRQQFRILENIVPHPMIASYLGITNISLSRLRNTLAKE